MYLCFEEESIVLLYAPGWPWVLEFQTHVTRSSEKYHISPYGALAIVQEVRCTRCVSPTTLAILVLPCLLNFSHLVQFILLMDAAG